MPNLIESLMATVGPQIVRSLSSRLGESESAVQNGLQSSSATILGSIASKAGDSNFLGQVFNMITGAGSMDILGNLSSLAAGNAPSSMMELGSKFLSLILGPQQSNATDAIAATSGLRASSASSLLGMAGPLVMGLLANRVKEGSLNPRSFATMLISELPALKSILPSGLGALISGLGPVREPAGPAVTGIRPGGAPVAATQGSMWKWLVPLVVLGLALAYWLMNRGPQQVNTAKESIAPAAAPASLGEFFKRKLPNGVELNIPERGIENKLIGYIEDRSKVLDTETWFNFDRLLFDTGKATLQPSSAEQVSNIAAILKAYPNVNVKLGGYTDNVGDKDANMRLSGARANAVMGELEKLGVDSSRMAAEGYGDAHPVASNDTEDGRQQNRRIALRVTKT